MVFTTDDPPSFPKTLLQRMDFVISGAISFSDWKVLLEDYFLKESGKDITGLRNGKMNIISPGSRKTLPEGHHRSWGPEAMTISCHNVIPPCYPISELLAQPNSSVWALSLH
jgi:hypothetical protein